MEVKILPPGPDAVILEGWEHDPGSCVAEAPGSCPRCGAVPLLVKGLVAHAVKSTPHEHCTEWEAVTVCCGRGGWTIGVRFFSLFGFEEDEAVLHGRARVYP